MLNKPRRKSNDGRGSSIVSSKPTLPRTLENEYLAGRAAEAAAKRVAKPEEPRHRGRVCQTPEETLLKIRALYEYAHWAARELEAYFNLPVSRIHQIVYYQVAGGVVPIEEDVPEDAVRPHVPDRRRGPRLRPPAPAPMAGTLRSLEEVRAQKAADDAQAALIESELVDPAELRLGDEG